MLLKLVIWADQGCLGQLPDCEGDAREGKRGLFSWWQKDCCGGEKPEKRCYCMQLLGSPVGRSLAPLDLVLAKDLSSNPSFATRWQ